MDLWGNCSELLQDVNRLMSKECRRKTSAPFAEEEEAESSIGMRRGGILYD
jgi:hypothetical protein